MKSKENKLSEISGRFIRVIDTMGYSAYRIAKETGEISQPVITHIRKGRNEPSLKAVIALLKLFPQINPSWLLLGEGTMFLDDHNSVSGKSKIVPGTKSHYANDLKELLEAKDKIIAAAEKMSEQNQLIIEYLESQDIKKTIKEAKEKAAKAIKKTKKV